MEFLEPVKTVVLPTGATPLYAEAAEKQRAAMRKRNMILGGERSAIRHGKGMVTWPAGASDPTLQPAC